MGGATDIGVWNTPVHVVPPMHAKSGKRVGMRPARFRFGWSLLPLLFLFGFGLLASRGLGRPGFPHLFWGLAHVSLPACRLRHYRGSEPQPFQLWRCRNI